MMRDVPLALTFDSSGEILEHQDYVSKTVEVQENFIISPVLAELPPPNPRRPGVFRILGDRLFDDEESFRHVTEQYQHGQLTLGEAAELLGMGRYEYNARLAETGIFQESEPRTEGEIAEGQVIIRRLREE